ncbi:MAG TPA: HdeA/HdeB family chaperone [Rhizomicrobium sp.]|nr:HdeA/HdeB family chaperone [Rhizomicrobium sp.]
MRRGAVAIGLLALSGLAARADVVTLSFYKDSCEKFLQSEPSDQNMYLMWATGRVRRGLRDDQKAKFDDMVIAQQLRTYCGANPTTSFADAAYT